ncbi:MAG: acetyl-CoA C-acetyltransferase [Gammaproteobacteria bacterium]|nr:MAG: acetyl-CoA C-acetyltransferase [Gammaproteobacteria bacterium]
MATNKSNRAVYIVDGSRTPFLKARGVPGPFTASDLAVNSGRQLLSRQSFDPAEFDEVILGCIMPGFDEANIARVVSLRLGCGKLVPAWTVQRNCASGMQSIDSAAQNIAMGRSDLVLAGGTEAMSYAPLVFSKVMATWFGNFSSARDVGSKLKILARFRPAMLAPVIAILKGLSDPIVGLSMGQTAEIIAHRFSVTREAMDAYAVQSHQRLTAAMEQGRLSEIEVLYDSRGKYYEHDDGVRADANIEKLATLKPVFDREFGLVTSANSSQITDGAAWVILASEDAVKKHQLPVLARVVDSEWAGLDPGQMGLGPVHAMSPILKRNKLKIEDVDYWELNEAFAAQVLACIEAWKDSKYCRTELHTRSAIGEIDQSKLNVDGGGISLGHPVGASGARVVLHLCHLLEQNNVNRGLASLCIGGGQGGAMLLERDSA